MSAMSTIFCLLENVPVHARLACFVAYTLGRVRTDIGRSAEVALECFARELVVLQSDVPCSSSPVETSPAAAAAARQSFVL